MLQRRKSPTRGPLVGIHKWLATLCFKGRTCLSAALQRTLWSSNCSAEEIEHYKLGENEGIKYKTLQVKNKKKKHSLENLILKC